MVAWRSTTDRKRPRFKRRLDFGGEAFDRIEPGGRVRREVEDEARVPVEPSADLWMFVGGVAAENDVDHLAGGHFGVDRVEKADELPMAVALHVVADDGAVKTLSAANRVVMPWRL